MILKILVAEKLSEHRYKTPEGYLICVDSVLARTGKQTYRRNEIFADSGDDRLIEVDRKAEEVFSPETMASFENKPICVEHPDVDVNSGNISEFAVGFVRDIHKGEYGGEPVMLGTLVITDAKTVEEIENGEHTDLSCGYDCDIEDCDSPEQKHIRGNHIALCEHGRAGIARIVDSVKDEQLYAVEFVYDGDSWSDYLGHVNVRAKSEQDALAKAKRWAVKHYDNPGFFKIASTKYTNVETIDGIKDEESTYTEVTKNLEKEADKDMKWLDSVIKDAEQTFRVLAAVPGDYDDEPGFDIIFNVKANSENEAIAKAKKYAEKTPAYRFAWGFRLAEHNQHTRIERNVDSVKDESNDFLNTQEHRRLIYEFMENNGNSFIISKEKNRLLKYIEKETGIKNADWHDVMYIIKNHTRAKLFDEEIKDYVPFPKKDALNKSNGLEEIKRIINNKDNTLEDTEGMLYLTQKAYNDIKTVIKFYGITQKELEGISKYFFGPGGYNMFG